MLSLECMYAQEDGKGWREVQSKGQRTEMMRKLAAAGDLVVENENWRWKLCRDAAGGATTTERHLLAGLDPWGSSYLMRMN